MEGETGRWGTDSEDWERLVFGDQECGREIEEKQRAPSKCSSKSQGNDRFFAD